MWRKRPRYVFRKRSRRGRLLWLGTGILVVLGLVWLIPWLSLFSENVEDVPKAEFSKDQPEQASVEDQPKQPATSHQPEQDTTKDQPKDEKRLENAPPEKEEIPNNLPSPSPPPVQPPSPPTQSPPSFTPPPSSPKEEEVTKNFLPPNSYRNYWPDYYWDYDPDYWDYDPGYWDYYPWSLATFDGVDNSGREGGALYLVVERFRERCAEVTPVMLRCA